MNAPVQQPPGYGAGMPGSSPYPPSQYPPPSAPSGVQCPYPAPTPYPSGMPGQNPAYGTLGAYQPTGMQGVCSPSGMSGGYPPSGMPVYFGGTDPYPSNFMPGNAQPGMPTMYPPSIMPGHYPPSGMNGHSSPSGMPGAHLRAGTGPDPPSGLHGNRPPQGGAGQYALNQQGMDAEDSDGCDYLRPKGGSATLNVRFANQTNKKVKLYTTDHRGKFKKTDKVGEGKVVSISTREGQPWIAEGKKGTELAINGNVTLLPYKAPEGGSDLRAEITRETRRIEDLRSSTAGVPGRVKFSNRSSRRVILKKVDASGQWKRMKELYPRKAWLIDSCEGHYWVACAADKESERLHMNHGRYYMVTNSGLQRTQKVLITEPRNLSSSSSDSD